MTDYSSVIKTIQALDCKVTENEPMAKHTSFRIGGPADLYVTVSTAEQLIALRELAQKQDIPMMLIGNGSNLLVSDAGIRGIVVRLDGDFCKVEYLGKGVIRAGSGASLSNLCLTALENSLTGAEFAWGIPGSIGGAAFMNAGAYGGELKDIVTEVEYITTDGTVDQLTNEQCGFEYRGSIFQKSNCIVTAITVKLKEGDMAQIKAEMDDILGRRKSKQPLDMPSAGSTFKRPVGYFAGGLIEQCGLKGCSVGGAQVSEKHAGFVVNTGGATCQDVLDLIKHIQDTVLQQTGVTLECEVKAIGG
ncbi:MAG: UDP-N-acetylmuramate dehydrogenase [Ruminococcaceae bacterium]|nr:UDP-N-acetylmuramate dehydrogenase [Oscillospiraceae bacterium]